MIALATALAAAACPQADDPARHRRLVELLDSPDVEVRRLARAELAAAGPAALPAIREALLRRGSDVLVEILLEIYRADPAADAGARWVQEAWVDALRARLAAPGEVPADAYVAARLREATAHYDEGRYEVAREIARALAVLEPSGPRAGDLARFQAACEQRLVDSRLLCSRLEVACGRTVVGEPVPVRLTVRNVSDQPVAVTYGLLGGRIVLEHERRLVDAANGEEIRIASATVEFPPRLELAAGEAWEASWMLDTVGEDPQDPRGRLYRVEGWTAPARIEAGGQTFQARLLFPPVEVRGVPEFAREAVREPTLAFRRALSGGSAQEAFLAAFLIEEPEERMSAAECLVRMLPDLEAAPRGAAYAILARLTGEAHGDTAAWLRWLRRRERAREPGGTP